LDQGNIKAKVGKRKKSKIEVNWVITKRDKNDKAN